MPYSILQTPWDASGELPWWDVQYAIMMTPIGLAIDTTNFYRPVVAIENSKAPERHNVDKNMLAQDLALIPMETIFQARITAAKAMAELLLRWRMEVWP